MEIISHFALEGNDDFRGGIPCVVKASKACPFWDQKLQKVETGRFLFKFCCRSMETGACDQCVFLQRTIITVS